MAIYFPSLLKNQQDALPILNDVVTFERVGRDLGASSAAYVIDVLIGMGETSVLGPIAWAVDLALIALYLIDLFSQPGRIDVQKEVVETYFDPLTHYLAVNYCYPITAPYFKEMSADAVEDAFRRRPDLSELRDTMYPQARDLVDAGIGLGGRGQEMNKRIVNQCLANWERHGWSTQLVIDGWQGILNAAEVGPQPNGPPPPDSPVARGIAGMQVGALLREKWWTQEKFLPEDWDMFADYYVQQGFNNQEGRRQTNPESQIRWDAIFNSPWQGNPPPRSAPQVLELPAAQAYFSPQCLQTGPPYPDIRQPGGPYQTPYQRACFYWTLRYSGQAIPPDLALWVAQEENAAAVAEASIDPKCGYQQPGPDPIPQPPYYPWPQPPSDPRGGPQPEPQPPWPQPPYDPWPQPPSDPRGQPPDPTPLPQPWLQPRQLACQYWTLYYAGQPIPDWLLAWAVDERNAEVMIEASHDPACGYTQDQPIPPDPQPQPPYQRACEYWLLLRRGQPIPPRMQAWIQDPANYPALSEAYCDPACGYDATQPWPFPPDQPPDKPPGEQCPKPCQDQIDDLYDKMRRTRPPWQRNCEEWPPSPQDQDCWQWPWPQQPWPPPWPQPWPREWPPGWPCPPASCFPGPPEPPPGEPGNPPQPPGPPGPPDPPGPPEPPPEFECTPTIAQQIIDCIWPLLRDRVCLVTRECERTLSCLRLFFCDIGQAAYGIFADCWKETHTAHVTYATSFLRPHQFPFYVTDNFRKLTQQQRTGDFRVACEHGRDVFQKMIANQVDTAPLIASYPHYRGWVHTPPSDRRGFIQIRTVDPHQEEIDPCARP